MFMSQFKQWLEAHDPYGLQRIVLYKALFIATVGTYVYWLFLPASFQSFFSFFLVLAFYESPALLTFAEKERLLIFMGIAIMLISVSFYLVYPFKGTFFFFSVAVLALTYFSVLKYFYALKNLTMLLIVNGAIILSTEPQGNLQVAYSFISAIALAMTTTLICLRVLPNQYLHVWNKAVQKFIHCLEEDIHYAIKEEKNSVTEAEILHLGIARNYRKLLPKKYMMQAYRIATNLRNIQHSLDNLYYETKNELFWHGIKDNLQALRLKMPTYTPCELLPMPIAAETKLQHYIMHCLHQAFTHWNTLCSLQQK